MTKTTALATGFAVALAAVGVQAQRVTGTAETHLAAAKAAAGTQWTALQQRVCESAIPAPPAPRAAGAGEAGRAGGGGRQAGPPPPSQWHVEPAKVFDNLYFVGMTDWSAWALTTSQGIIVIDAIFDYSVEDEVVNGLKKLGLNPADIKYVLISHAHTDHIGGAKYLQDHFGPRLVMSKEDCARPHARNDLQHLQGEGSRHDAHRRDVGRDDDPGRTAGDVSRLHRLRRSLPRHRQESRRRYRPVESHRVRQHARQHQDACDARSEGSQSVHRRQRRRAALHHHR
ncbi:MAG: hypothetical protein DMF87_14485 [Acidobacteria bacterium]|nr:MAG: hypothetical protein DMF87_14485 [Acidobacteriota bacterium]